MSENENYHLNIIIDDDEKNFIYYFDAEQGDSYRGYIFREPREFNALDIVESLSEKISSLYEGNRLKIMSEIPLRRDKTPIRGVSKFSEKELEEIVDGLNKKNNKIKFYVKKSGESEQKTS